MTEKDIMHLANNILGEVKPLKLRQHILRQLIDFIDDKCKERTEEAAKKCYYGLLSRYYDKEMSVIFHDYIEKEFGVEVE